MVHLVFDAIAAGSEAHGCFFLPLKKLAQPKAGVSCKLPSIWAVVYGDYFLRSSTGILIDHYKDPYETNRFY